ncbi:MAG: hypothetical protein R8F63_21265 [Acidimicrobiales bacterium]|nr:hypothetical protein [Acidimicrobiales bacterium]
MNTALETATPPSSEQSSNRGASRGNGGEGQTLRWLLTAILVGVIASALFAAILAAFLVAGDDAGTLDPGVVSAEGPAETMSSADRLVAFGAAWDHGDWDALSALASPAAVATAQEWFEAGGNASDGLAFVADSCADSASCQIVYAPPAGFGLLFDLTLGTNAEGALVVTELTFGGDTG